LLVVFILIGQFVSDIPSFNQVCQSLHTICGPLAFDFVSGLSSLRHVQNVCTNGIGYRTSQQSIIASCTVVLKISGANFISSFKANKGLPTQVVIECDFGSVYFPIDKYM
jgi:hypothetical protein